MRDNKDANILRRGKFCEDYVQEGLKGHGKHWAEPTGLMGHGVRIRLRQTSLRWEGQTAKLFLAAEVLGKLHQDEVEQPVVNPLRLPSVLLLSLPGRLWPFPPHGT